MKLFNLSGLTTRITIGWVFTIAGLMFVVPIVLLYGLSLTKDLAQIDFAETEIEGITAAQPAFKAIEQLMEHRGLMGSVIAGDDGAKGQVSAVRVKVDDAFALIDKNMQTWQVHVGRELKTEHIDAVARLKKIHSEWNTLKSGASSLTREKSFEEHSTLLRELGHLVREIYQLSGLALDPDASSYYLQNASYVFLPELAEAIDAARSKGASIALNQSITTEERVALSALIDGQAKSLTALFNKNIEHANASDQRVGAVLGKDAKQVEKSLEEVENLADTAFIKAESITITRDEWFQKASTAIDDLFTLEHKAQDLLVTLLKGRETKLYRKLYTEGAIALVLVALAFLVLFVLGRGQVNLSLKRAADAEDTNRRNESSIMRLMNELSDVSTGDLTIKATVDEQITGGVADAVNVTVGELRNVVKSINQAAAEVTTTTQQAQAMSNDLLGAAQQQATEIQTANEQISLLAQSAGEVSIGAAQSSEVARQALEAAKRGSSAVQNTIRSMTDIRDQIQDTSKRIKRLGESSQEVGEIVDVISDLTDQTNVLALNAAIQAAAAGEAGRGFSVVAEEVQRLAERSADATRRIGAIIKTIQTDTQETVAAMEKSTQGVVEGTALSDAAGKALADIESVSQTLSERINGISNATEVQKDVAAEARILFETILKITAQTSAGTKGTAQTLTQLAGLADGLRNSVAAFKV